MTRLGLIGIGTWGQRYSTTISKRSDCRIIAFAASSATSTGSIPGALRCATWREVLDLAISGDLDAVIAATTPANQAEIAAAAAMAGVPLLVEKPLGASPSDAEEVRRCFDRSARKAPIVVDYVHLFAPAYRGLKHLVETSEGGIASVIAIESEGSNRGPFRNWSPLLDYAPHDLAMCFDLLGLSAELRLVEATRSRSSSGGELFEARFQKGAATVVMRLGNGAVTKSRRFAVTVAGGRSIVYDDCLPHPTKLVDRGAAVAIDETLPLDAALTHFLVQQRLWAESGAPPFEGARWLELSVRVAEIIDTIERMVSDLH